MNKLKVLPYPENLYCDIVFDDVAEKIKKCMAVLTQRERFVIEERYKRGATLRVIADELGISFEYARQIEAKARRKMRKEMEIA